MTHLDSLYTTHRAAPSHAAETALYGAVRRLAASIVARSIRHDREDVTADIVLHVFQAMDTMRDSSVPFSVWVRSIAERRINDAIRRTGRRPKLIGVDPHILDRHRDDAVAGDRSLLAASMPGLADEQRDLLRRFVATPDYVVLAAELGVTPTVLRRKLHRLKNKIETRDSFLLSSTT